ncbi:MAG: AAA family ATPase [Proteobacteria bacterium]|nr:AAA family ATPase [Pseudomonadota bacterium]
MTKAQIIAITNQKGGVGKTTTAVNLATALAASKRRVLVVDADPQGNAGTGFDVSPDALQKDLYRLVAGQTTISQAITPTKVDSVDLLPASTDLAALEVELVDKSDRNNRLKSILDSIADRYDYMLIDCPPSLGLLTVNALVAADSVLIPLQCEYYALEGLSHLMDTIQRVQKGLNPRLTIKGVLLTMYDSRNKLSSMVDADVRGHLTSLVYKTIIPRNVRVSESPSHGQPVLLYDIDCAGSSAYIALAAEVIKQETREVAHA